MQRDEFPGVKWVKVGWIIGGSRDPKSYTNRQVPNLPQGSPVPRCQDLPSAAFGDRSLASRAFAVTHPWLAFDHPDPDGSQMSVLQEKLEKMQRSRACENDDVVFFDYMSLPQVSRAVLASGGNDRSDEEQEMFDLALSGDTMGRIYLTSRVVIIDDIPEGSAHNTAYLDRGWSYFEASVAG